MKNQPNASHNRILNFLKLEGGFVMMLSGEVAKVPTTKEECEVIFNKLETCLSPENLHCDGEISGKQARKKYLFYQAVWADVEAIAGYKRAEM